MRIFVVRFRDVDDEQRISAEGLEVSETGVMKLFGLKRVGVQVERDLIAAYPSDMVAGIWAEESKRPERVVRPVNTDQ